jgi:hypothetical protein
MPIRPQVAKKTIKENNVRRARDGIGGGSSTGSEATAEH